MSQHRITTRYAKALLDLGIEKKMLEELFADAEMLVETCKQSRELVLLLKNPVVMPAKKLSILKQLFEKNLQAETNKFIEVVVRKNRSVYIYELFKRFVEMYREYKGIASAELQTAVESSKELRDKVTQLLADTTGNTIELNTEVDEELIGGFMIRYKDRLVDASVASKLKDLKKKLID